jgi:hypothetical protein
MASSQLSTHQAGLAAADQPADAAGGTVGGTACGVATPVADTA